MMNLKKTNTALAGCLAASMFNRKFPDPKNKIKTDYFCCKEAIGVGSVLRKLLS